MSAYALTNLGTRVPVLPVRSTVINKVLQYRYQANKSDVLPAVRDIARSIRRKHQGEERKGEYRLTSFSEMSRMTESFTNIPADKIN